ncbi:MAG: hypothetical protein CMP59_11055 [Flavobacteriales bacterium]|nr:hypothetical protein [Flavobacteriales bacterium]|tara:strand:- start:523 stop:1257 length:735 start_codon:yes stop_codon:yes gene_type:complete
MKKLLSLIILSFVFSIGYGQEKSFQLGLQVSPTFGWIKPDVSGVDNEGTRFGFNFGITGDFNIAENYSISTGILIVNTGGRMSYPDIVDFGTTSNPDQELGRSEVEIRLRYIELPLTLKLKTNQIGYWTYYGQFGFGAAFNYDAEGDITSNSPNRQNDISQEEVDFADEVNLFRASLIVGLGAEYNISGNTSLIFGLTFDNGFTNIFDFNSPIADGNGNAENTTDTQAVKAINNYIAINLGILF